MHLKKYFLAGLLVWVPLAITVWVLYSVVGFMDRTLELLPGWLQPREVLGVDVPGFGVLLTMVVVYVTGVLAANFLGRRLVLFWESLLNRIPVVRSIYSGVKQVTDTLLRPDGQAFRKVVLVEYPRPGLWTLAFLTSAPDPLVARSLPPADYLSIYVPTTPNPTSGFLLMVRQQDVRETAMGVDEALKYIISLGVVTSAPPQLPQT